VVEDELPTACARHSALKRTPSEAALIASENGCSCRPRGFPSVVCALGVTLALAMLLSDYEIVTSTHCKLGLAD
jgi:hypothetical protein